MILSLFGPTAETMYNVGWTMQVIYFQKNKTQCCELID